MEITINIDVLNRNDLSLSEYVYLKALYEKIPRVELSLIFSCIDKIEEDSLQMRGFIKILPNEGIVLRDKANKLFESVNLFNTFVTTFPVKTPVGRYLSPVGLDTIKADKLEKKWNKLFKNKPHLERKAIAVLEAELEWRVRTNQLEYIHNAEAWLNQGDYENFEYLLDDYKKDTQNHDDFM